MKIEDFKNLYEESLINYFKEINKLVERENLKIPKTYGIGKYLLINQVDGHYVFELLGFQELTDNPAIITEIKTNTYDLNYFINGGKMLRDYSLAESIYKIPPLTSYDGLFKINSLYNLVTKDEDFIKYLFDDYQVYGNSNGFVKESADLPFLFKEKAINTFFQNVTIISKVNKIYSFRRHSSTLLIEKNMPEKKFKKLLKEIFDIKKIKLDGQIMGGRFLSQQISELMSMAYHKIDETAIDKFLQLISDEFRKALGYKSIISSPRLKIIGNQDKFNKQFMIPDFMLEREDGYYDILDLKTGLLNYQFAVGDWSNSYLQNYGTKLLGQLKGYERYFKDKDNAKWALNNLGIKCENPKLIGVTGNHNNFNREIVNIALESNTPSFLLLSYNELIQKLKTQFIKK